MAATSADDLWRNCVNSHPNCFDPTGNGEPPLWILSILISSIGFFTTVILGIKFLILTHKKLKVPAELEEAFNPDGPDQSKSSQSSSDDESEQGHIYKHMTMPSATISDMPERIVHHSQDPVASEASVVDDEEEKSRKE